MATSRQQRIVQFREATLSGEREEADHILFRILYGLPADIQIAVARHLTARFLPIFRANHPEVTWVAPLLDDLDAYHREHEQGMPDEPENRFGGDMSFDVALCALLRAVSFAKQNNLPRVTPSCCTALMSAVSARASNVWHCDDPEAVQAWNHDDSETLRGRNARHNPASQAVTKREWLIVADWLEEHGVGDFPEADEAECEHWLAWWLDRECLL
ncbi:hypothetical protein [Haliangium sp.]|uniref:hypothetical protein n=1 Tax=Haliangium sp. TaxID=2663208 RepID=UPI003D09B411